MGKYRSKNIKVQNKTGKTVGLNPVISIII